METINKFEDLIEIGYTLGENWFRGHSRIIGELTPSVYRKKLLDDLFDIFKPDFETNAINHFKRLAPAISNNLPDEKDNLSWLFLMQHHGMPTRLLDWTENILFATFFAINNDMNEDGELWTLYPGKLNEAHKIHGMPLPNNRILNFLSVEMLHNNPDKLIKEKKFNLQNRPECPLAFLPPLKLLRMTAQSSAFTIHPDPKSSKTIQDVVNDEKYLKCYKIPKKLKKEFYHKLKCFNVTNRHLFMDLDGLAKDFKNDINFLGWGKPNPPKLE